MHKLILLVLVVAAAEAVKRNPNIIYPTYRPPPTRPPPPIRFRREDRGEPQWLYQGDVPRAPSSGDHPLIPNYIDDVKLDPERRYARSVDSPSAKRGGGGHSPPSNRDTGATHPGYNRRNTRSVKLTFPQQPMRPNPFRKPPIYEPRRPPVAPLKPTIYV